MHSKRVIVAVITIPILYLYVTKLPPFYYMCLLVVLSTLAQLEFNNMYKIKPTLSLISIIGGIGILASQYLDLRFQYQIEALPILLILCVMLITSVRLFQVKNPKNSLKDIAPAIIGLVYIPLLLLPQLHIRMIGSEWIVLLYGSVWASDSLAYYVGKGVGKHKLYFEVSPNKTLEGGLGSLVGGLVCSPLIAWGMGMLGNQSGLNLGVVGFCLIGFFIGLFTIFGDLVESMFKRDAEIKDSGGFLPGHGGILDKLDGVLFAGPLLYFIQVFLR